MEKPKLQLTGENGNVFNIMGLAFKAAKAANWPKEKIEKFKKELISGDYDHALQTCMKWFDVS